MKQANELMLPDNIRQIIESPLIKDSNIRDEVRKLYTFAIQYMGLKGSITEHDLNTAVNFSTADIEHQYPYLRINELQVAVNNGVRGEYGDNFGLNAATFNKWIKNYIQTTRPELLQPYSESIKRHNQELNDAKRIEAEKKQQDEMKSRFNLETARQMTIDLYKKHRIIMYGGGEFYRHLVSEGQICDNWEKYIPKVEQWAKGEKLKRMNNGQKHNDLTEVLVAIQSNAMDKIQLNCRQMILQEWIEKVS